MALSPPEADDETSAGSALSPHDTDTEHSEADERCPEAFSSA